MTDYVFVNTLPCDDGEQIDLWDVYFKSELIKAGLTWTECVLIQDVLDKSGLKWLD